MAKAAWESAPVVDGGGPAWMSAPEIGSAPEQPVAQAPAAKPAPLTRTDRFVKGLRDPIDGGAQLLTNMLPEGVVSAGNRLNNWLADNTGLVGRLPAGGVDQQVREAEQAYQARRAASEPTSLTSLVTGQKQEPGFDGYRVLGNILNPANMAVAARLPAAASFGGRVALGAGGGALSSLLNPVTTGDNFAEEKGKQVAIGTVLGGAVPAVTSTLARLVRPNASVNPDLALLRGEGVRPTIGQTLGGRWNSAEEKLMSVPVLGDAISNARGTANRQFNNAAINRASGQVGEVTEGVGQGAVANAGNAVSAAYDDALNRAGPVRFDQRFGADIRQLTGMAQNLVPQMRDRFNRTLQDIVGDRISPAGAMTARTFKDVDSELGQLASRYRGSSLASESEFGDSLAQLQSLVRQQMARNNPQVARDLAAADAGWANLVRVEGASKAAKNSEGVFTPAQLNAAIQAADRSTRKRAVSRGEALMQDLGTSAQNVLGNKVPNSGTTDRALMTGLATLGGGAAINPAIPLGLLGGAALYAPPVQNAITALLTQRPQAANAIAQALRQGSPALVPAAAQIGIGLSQ